MSRIRRCAGGSLPSRSAATAAALPPTGGRNDVGQPTDTSCPRAAEVFPLVEELAPAPDAWQMCLRLAHLPHVMFLDSAARLPELGRYSFLTADPFLWIEGRGREVKS